MEILIMAGIGVAVVALLDILCESITSLAVEIGIAVSTEILNPKMFSFKINDIYSILPKITSTSQVSVISDINFINIFKTLGWAILILGTLISAINSFVASTSGNKAKNPGQVVVNSIMSAVLMVAIFGVGNFSGLINEFGELMNKVMSLVTEGFVTKDAQGNALLAIKANDIYNSVKAAKASRSSIIGDLVSATNGNISSNQVVYLIYAVAITSGVVRGAITYIERYLSMAMYLMVGPICVGFNSMDETKDTCKQWFMGLVTQALAILLSIICWRFFFVQVCKEWTLLNLTITLAILSLVSNSEKLLNAIGLKTMVNGDSARMFLGAAASTGIAISSAANTMFRAGTGLTGAVRSDIGNMRMKNANKGMADEKFIQNIEGAKNLKDVKHASEERKLDYRKESARSKEMFNKGPQNMNESSTSDAVENLKDLYRKEMIGANGDGDKIAQIREDYANAYKELTGKAVGFEHYAGGEKYVENDFPYVPGAEKVEMSRNDVINAATNDNYQNELNVPESNGYNSSLISSVQSVNDVMNADSDVSYANGSDVNAALALEDYGLNARGMLQCEIETPDTGQINTGLIIAENQNVYDSNGRPSIDAYVVTNPNNFIGSSGSQAVLDDANDVRYDISTDEMIRIGDNVALMKVDLDLGRMTEETPSGQFARGTELMRKVISGVDPATISKRR